MGMRPVADAMFLVFPLAAAFGISAQTSKSMNDRLGDIVIRLQIVEEADKDLANVVPMLAAGVGSLLQKSGAPDDPAPRTPDPRIGDFIIGAYLHLLGEKAFACRKHDSDGNGVRDYWTRDVAGLCRLKWPEFRADGDMMLLAKADSGPEAGYPGLEGGLAPLRGYCFRALERDQDGAPYVQKDLPPSDIQGAPRGSCSHRRRFGFCAFPIRPITDGAKTFIINEVRQVWKKDLGREAHGVKGWPRPEAPGSGWEPLIP